MATDARFLFVRILFFWHSSEMYFQPRGSSLLARTTALALALSTVIVTRADDDAAATARAAPNRPPDDLFAIAPVAGFDRNEYSAFNPFTGRSEAHKDTAGEYGLQCSYTGPQVNLNNILFYTDPNDCKVWGDILAGSVSGDPQAQLTWCAGGSYTWHQIEMPDIALRIQEPLVRAGPLFRFPDWHVTLNPYVGYAHLAVHTTYGSDAWDTSVYGILARWDWRMLHVMAQYYLQDNPAKDQVYQVFRTRLLAFVTRDFGFQARVEYLRQYTSKDLSLLCGPVLVF